MSGLFGKELNLLPYISKFLSNLKMKAFGNIVGKRESAGIQHFLL